MNIPLLLIVFIILTIIAINYILNNFRQTTIKFNVPYCRSVPEIGESSRLFNLFDKDTLDNINNYFDYERNLWDSDEYGEYKLFDKILVSGYKNFKFRVGIPKFIKSGTLIIFPKNEKINWNKTFYMKCTITGKLFYPEENSIILSKHDIIVIGINGSEKLVLSD